MIKIPMVVIHNLPSERHDRHPFFMQALAGVVWMHGLPRGATLREPTSFSWVVTQDPLDRLSISEEKQVCTCSGLQPTLRELKPQVGYLVDKPQVEEQQCLQLSGTYSLIKREYILPIKVFFLYSE
jgi:hypothetical protein